jgi:hypothetical protein
MAHHVKVDKREIEALKKRLEQFGRQDQIEQFITSCAKNLAARLLAKVIKRTPVGQYDTPVYFKDGEAVTFTPHTGKMGGTLRRGWTAKTEAEAESGSAAGAAEYTQSLTIQHEGSD